MCMEGVACNELSSSYKFYLALKNNDCRGYVTEKYWKAILKCGMEILHDRLSPAQVSYTRVPLRGHEHRQCLHKEGQ